MIQLLKLRAQDVPVLKSWLARKESKWLSHDILNEMLEIMAHNVLRVIIKEIQSAEFFSVILDETADITVKDALNRFSLPIEKCRGQCYDSAASVSGIRRGLQACVQE
ncbi:MAG: hypothetical protein ACRCZO_02815, partial [Cetobacterium sp.]